MFEGFASQWSPVMPARLLVSGKAIGLKLAGTPIVLFRDAQGRARALVDRCPHRGVALSLGKVREGCLECPFHGWQFDGEGQVQTVPWNPDAKRARLHARALPTAEVAAQVWVYTALLEEGAAPPPPPEVAEAFMRPDVRLHSFAVQWKTHWTRGMENMLDWPHLPFVHRSTIGRGMEARPDSRMDVQWEATPWGATSRIAIDGVALPGALDLRWPNVMHLTIPIPGKLLVLSAACVPVDQDTMQLITTSARDFLRPGLFDFAFHLMNRRIGSEDKAIVESSSPAEIPKPSEEAAVRTDGLTLHFRKRYHAELRGRGARQLEAFVGSDAATG